MLFKESMTSGIASNIIDNNTLFCDQLFRQKMVYQNQKNTINLQTNSFAFRIFADEAMTFFTGQLKNNLGLLNKIWKNEPLSVSRKKEGTIRLNAYLTFLLMVQPEVFEEYLERHGKKAVSSGFLARFLFTETVSTIGQRRINLNQDNSRQALDNLFTHLNKFLIEQKEHFYDTSKSHECHGQ